MGSLNADDFIGQVFGLLTVQGNANDLKSSKRKWICLCVCGKIVERVAFNVKTGMARSCGHIKGKRTHRQTSGGVTPEYKTWQSIIRRCTKPQSKDFSNYGGRGITVCEEWLSFINFYADMGPRPSLEYSIERKDNDLGYFPGNCEWATKTTQARNKRNNRKITFDGKTQCLAEWAESTSIPTSTLRMRFTYGWTVEQVLTTPIQSQYSHRRESKPLTASSSL